MRNLFSRRKEPYLYKFYFNNNEAGTAVGGGIIFIPANINSVFTSTNCNFTGNEATDAGGLFIQEGSATITGGNFTGNMVSNNGGGLSVAAASTGDVTFTGVTFDMNETGTTGADNGGAVHLSSTYSSTATFSACTITNNTAEDNGGGIYNESPDAVLSIVSGTLIDNNTARDDAGGGIYTAGQLIVDNSTISNNKMLSEAGVPRFLVAEYTLIHHPGSFRDQEMVLLIMGNESGTGVVNTGQGGGIYLDGDFRIKYIKLNN